MKKLIIVIPLILAILAIGIVCFFLKNNDSKEQGDLSNLKLEFKNDFETSADSNMIATMEAVIVKVYEKSLSVIETDNTNELITVHFSNADNTNFTQGQEILIYFNGMVMTSYPAQIGNVGKIEIIKQKSDIQIPDDILRYCYSSTNNVSVLIDEFTRSGISFTIKDTNELPYDYSNEYSIYKKNKEAKMSSIDQNQMAPSTENSTPAYQGSGQVLWEEAPKVSNIDSKDTGIFENINEYTIKKTYNWTNLYGELVERRI